MSFFYSSWWQRLRQALRWRSGHSSEVGFWDRYLCTKGLRWPDEFAERMNPDLELSADLAALLKGAAKTARVLDVGAGPLTIVGKKLGGGSIDLTAVDPLAPQYDQLLSKHGLNPPVRTQAGKAEELAVLFAPDSFDLAHARNCLDHALDPFQAVQQMLAVVKPGGWVYLKHHPDEGMREQWHGLHQWNFSRSTAGDFIISSRSRELNATSTLASKANVLCDLTCEGGEEWIIVKIHKRLS
jgi:SAM-dependent methyltransferase